MNSLRTSTLAAMVQGGFVAGTIDIASAALINHISPLIILRAIASGLPGSAALAGGTTVELLGLGLQWAMSLLIAAIFVLLARGVVGLRTRWVAAGVMCGVVVFTVMNFVVVPLSAAYARKRFR